MKTSHYSQVNILFIGNNPLEMSSMLETISRVPERKITTEIAFDVKSSQERLNKFQPDYILIDDNIGKKELSETVDSLMHNAKTNDVPITVLKNSNYEEAVTTSNVMDYLLKKNLTAELLFNAMKNTLKFKRTRQYLLDAYNMRSPMMKLAH